MAVLAATAPLALTTARLPRPIGATRLRVETTLVLSRRAALQRRVRMRIARARTVRTRTRRGTISIRQLLRVRRLRAARIPRAGLTIVRQRGSLVRQVHLVRQARPLRGRIVRHNGRQRRCHSAMRAHHLRATKARHLHGAKVLLRRAAKVHHRKGRRFLRNRARDGENQWRVFSGRRLVLSCWPLSFMVGRGGLQVSVRVRQARHAEDGERLPSTARRRICASPSGPTVLPPRATVAALVRLPHTGTSVRDSGIFSATIFGQASRWSAAGSLSAD